MKSSHWVFGTALATGLAAWSAQAGAAVMLTTSLSAFEAAAGPAPVINTQTTGLFDPFALELPTTTAIPLADGFTIGLSSAAQVTQPQDGYPYLLSDGFSGDLFIPQDATGNQISTETLFTSGADALGFEVVPFSSDIGGPYNITVTLGTGQSTTISLPGADFNNGETTPAFFGYVGGPETSLTITATDPNGLAFGNFYEVPEPASLVLVLTGVGLVAGLRRRNA